ncbi:SIN4 [Candida oxycetoniae]|uniref:Mediator of RNA polymerase II transcription subunit 16 n=1 Tax=Candida oxycetoniae TaxID=497107 RepID=A0AAI9T1L9_9ASCO|nr:SIN4 [Candida oxycetoniae]KAI3406601.2 SIN4 [Candida oxycetoniae]
MENTNRYIQDVNPSCLISWSKNGFIVYVPPVKTFEYNLLLTYLENKDGENWSLAEPQPINVKLANSFLPEISLVSWSMLNTNLAVSDVYGNFYILLAGVRLLETKDSSPSYELTSYNHMEMIYRDIINQDINSPINPGALIVSFKWLNIEKSQILNKPASLVNLEESYLYNYGMSQYAPHGISHPIPTKQACVALRKNGVFMLYYQGEHKVEYHKTFLTLSSDPLLIDKASIGFTNDKEIIVTIWDSLSDDIITYSITIDWGFLIESAKSQKTDPHYHTPKENQKLPTLKLQKIHQMKPIPEFTNEHRNELTSIDIVSANADKESKLSILISYGSTIFRYQLVNMGDLLSDAFIRLRKTTESAAVTEEEKVQAKSIEFMDKLTRPGQIQSIVNGPSDLYTLVMYQSGHIDVIDNKTLKILNTEREFPPATISTMFDIGYTFPAIDHTNSLIMAVSPNMTLLVYTEMYGDNTNLILKPIEKVRNLSFQPKELFATTVAFAFIHAYACYTSICSNDLVILIQSEIDRLRRLLLEQTPVKNVNLIIQKFVESIISESHKSMNFQLDAFGKESVDKLLSNPPLQKLLSLQLTIGEAQGYSTMRNIAWIVLNLRSINFAIMFSLSSIYRQISRKKPSEDTMQDSITRAECILSLIGNIKWLIDLMTYFNQELLRLSFQNESNKLDTSNSVVIPVILSKLPRLFLMYAITSMGKTHEILKKLHKDLAESNKLLTPMKDSLNRYFTIVNNAPITLNLFENYLRECDALISKETLRFSDKEKGYSLKVEQKLILGDVSEVKHVAKLIVDRYTINVTKEIKLSELFFYNTQWLGLGPYKSGGNVEKKVEIDALRKIDIFDEKVRRCTRCGSISLVSDLLVYEPTTIGLWTMVFQRTCICGNAWVNK